MAAMIMTRVLSTYTLSTLTKWLTKSEIPLPEKTVSTRI
jgi:hypothetical protein